MNIIQVGTNKAYDNLSTIINKYSNNEINKLIMVEPFAYHNKSIEACYSNFSNKLYIENIVITPNENHDPTENIWYHHDDSVHSNAYELASLNKQHASNIRSNYQINDMKSLELPCLTLNELFNKYDTQTIDILYIDTEGFDDKLIYNINFDFFIIKKIFYENLHIDANKLREFLISKNYLIKQSIQEDPYADKAILCQ
mgnify:CR=1 FL=1